MQTILIGNDNNVTLADLTNAATGAALTAAAVEATLYDADGDEVPGQSWPLVLNHAGSGTYRGVLDAALSLTLGKVYRLTIAVDAGSGREARWDIDVRAAQRRE